MTIRKVYLVRHGEYDWDNQPSPEKGLTSRGREQANFTAKRLSITGASALYSSDLGRAVETAQIINGELCDILHETDSDLRECYLPGAGTTTVPADVLEAGEKRALAAFEKFLSARTRLTNEIIVSHGNVIRYWTARVLGCSDRWFRLRTHNCGVTELEINSAGSMWVVSYNDVGHLPAHLITEGVPRRPSSSAEPSKL
jgi:broad specificity phosphatase PhoE